MPERLIDANKLLKMRFSKGFNDDGELLVPFREVKKAIDLAPTVDAVHVVRCKNCKHSCFVKSCSKYECKKGCGTLKYSNDFCSYGEAKMDGKGEGE